MKNSISIEFLSRGSIAPLTSLTVGTPQSPGCFNGGVYYADNEVCQQGLHGKTHYSNVPEKIISSDFPVLRGSYIFGGMLQEHFGHFLTESLGRIWAVRHLSDKFDTIIFYHRIPGGKIPKFATDLLKIIAPNLKIFIVREPSIIEYLAVPRQVEEHGVVYGHPIMREAVVPLKEIRGEGKAKRVYVSRSGLNPRDGGFLFESLIEKNLENHGYKVIYPEKMTIHEQLAAYNDADELIFAEGSALHLYALQANPAQRVFIIWRRKVAAHFLWQIKTFGGPDKVFGQSFIKKLFVPPAGEVGAKAQLDFASLVDQLFDSGFISNKSWDFPVEDDFAREMERLQQITKLKYQEKIIK